MNATQTCYVCGKYFEDKVKLGLHLTPCYNEAVSVRKELWHPHPLDLVDEQRYTEYMKGRFQQREENIRDARSKNISFVTADNFEAMRGTLGPVAKKRPPSQDGRAPSQVVVHSPGHPSSPQQQQYQQQQYLQQQLPPPPPSSSGGYDLSHHQQVAQPVRQVATGVTMLRHELSSEIEKLKQLRVAEEQQSAARQHQFAQLLGQFETAKGPVAQLRPIEPSVLPPVVPPPSQAYYSQQQVPLPPPVHYAAPQYQGGGGAPQQSAGYERPVSRPSVSPQRPPSQSGGGVCHGVIPSGPHALMETTQQASYQAPLGEVQPDGRLRCGSCGKFFGKKGFEVHAQRCFRGPEDFTFSKDARFERNHPAPNQPVPQLQDARYQDHPVGGGAPAPGSDEWTQFMMTYPRPVLDEKPKTAKERNQAAMDAARKAEYQQMVAREMSGAPPPPTEEREATVPCGRCGRYFYASRVAKHEATCVSKPRK